VVTPITASEARADLYRLIDQAAESHQPILISGKRSSAVLVSAEDWQAIQETLYLLAIPGMRESIKKGMAEPLGKGAKAVVWRGGRSSTPSTHCRTQRSSRRPD
jgi:antitoxin YefM